MTRDPGRIKRITDKLAALWATQPDTRLGQINHHLSAVGYIDDDTVEENIDRGLTRAGIDPATLRFFTVCEHEWVTANNSHVSNAALCMKCRCLGQEDKILAAGGFIAGVSDFTVEDSQADQIARYGSTIRAL